MVLYTTSTGEIAATYNSTKLSDHNLAPKLSHHNLTNPKNQHIDLSECLQDSALHIQEVTMNQIHKGNTSKGYTWILRYWN